MSGRDRSGAASATAVEEPKEPSTADRGGEYKCPRCRSQMKPYAARQMRCPRCGYTERQ